MLILLLLDAAGDDAVFSVDTLEVLAALASERAYHQDFSGVSALDAEGTWSSELVVSANELVDVVGWIFHCFFFLLVITYRLGDAVVSLVTF